jgi:glycosyltransferase involved in cell wall biosynthesis
LPHNQRTASAFLTNGGHVLEVEDNARHREILAGYNVEPGSYYLVACRIEPENNIDTIIREFARSSVRQPLLIAGGANYKSPYLEELRQTKNPRVRFLGPVLRAEAATACRERITHYYSWDKVAHDHERYFRWIAGS